MISAAVQDFTAATDTDLARDRATVYRQTWIPLAQALLNNATHMQIAQDAARHGDFAQARMALGLIDLRPPALKELGERAAPLPDYHFLHGLISLGLGVPADFPNALLEHSTVPTRPADAETSYRAAIAATDDSDIIPQDSQTNDLRRKIFQIALDDLDRLRGAPLHPGLPPQVRQRNGYAGNYEPTYKRRYLNDSETDTALR